MLSYCPGSSRQPDQSTRSPIRSAAVNGFGACRHVDLSKIITARVLFTVFVEISRRAVDLLVAEAICGARNLPLASREHRCALSHASHVAIRRGFSSRVNYHQLGVGATSAHRGARICDPPERRTRSKRAPTPRSRPLRLRHGNPTRGPPLSEVITPPRSRVVRQCLPLAILLAFAVSARVRIVTSCGMFAAQHTVRNRSRLRHTGKRVERCRTGRHAAASNLDQQIADRMECRQHPSA